MPLITQTLKHQKFVLTFLIFSKWPHLFTRNELLISAYFGTLVLDAFDDQNIYLWQ